MSEKYFDYILKFCTLISAGLAIYITLINREIDRKLKDLDAIKRSVEIDQSKKQFDREFKFKIHDLTINAIKSKDEIQQLAAQATVSSMVENTDYVFKTGLLNAIILSSSVSPNVKAAAKVSNFDVEETRRKNPTFSKSNKIYVDIFYYEEGFEFTRKIAKKLRDALKTSDSYEVGLVKRFYKNLNSEKYHLSSNTIKYDSSEKDKAVALQTILNDLLSEDAMKVEIQLTNGGKETSKYMSLFIMGGKQIEE